MLRALPMHLISVLKLSIFVALSLGAFGSVAAKDLERSFGESTFRLSVPGAFAHESSGSPNAAVKTFGFATEPRADATRGLLQVTLVDLELMGGRYYHPVSAQELADRMIVSVAKDRRDWSLKTADAELSGVAAVRMAWSGARMSPVLGSSTAQWVAMEGVMYCGVMDGIGFALHVRDLKDAGGKTLELGEEAIRSFRLSLPSSPEGSEPPEPPESLEPR